ncbi:Exostosin-like-like protein [Hapsidospora chrysogenum ATCC 11550]|uniref:Exostosin-like-like protein n=1 Tax=Hapsidospora chrysogenum (strain ATCC 11550 / CBS 779.69 / DSM 880 / IAM 14645 / JCM 23072 / IMI 49137) TaxID=857340 RepID=A0A086ST38_HAPC1|nr:Exostosin-like-like protein [Hapsidospora chrysogenum ATCC 11550]
MGSWLQDALSAVPPREHVSSTVLSVVKSRLSWLTKRSMAIATASAVSLVCLYFLFRQDHFTQQSLAPPPRPNAISHAKVQQCAQGHEDVSDSRIWRKSISKYRNLMDDKFTIAIQTYQRPDRLNSTLSLLLGTEIPSLHEIVIIWNEIETQPPPDFMSDRNVTVRYRVSQKNSLNEKLRPDADYRTKAILLSDDDVHYDPADLDFVFQTWREQGQDRLTGAFARCATVNDAGKWVYSLCAKQSEYSMILTGLSFVHISFLEYYSSADPLMTDIRDYVDANFNCEDIALNFVVSMLACTGPLQVSGLTKPVNEMPPQGISRTPGHMDRRHRCVNEFVDYFGYMPLVHTTGYVTRGMIRG